MKSESPSQQIGGRKQWLLLGFSVLGLTAAATVLGFFLPVVLSEVTNSQLAIGFAVGVEGLAALTIPLVVGQASDRTWNRYGRRLPYMMVATPLILIGLLAVAVLESYWLMVGAVGLFFAGYYMYYTAYQSLYPDTLPDGEYGRAWAYQSIFQGTGVALALLGGGALLAAGLAAPFLAAAIIFVLVAAFSMRFIKEYQQPKNDIEPGIRKALPNFWRRLKQDRNLRWFLSAQFCWEYVLAALRAFVLLYLLKGLGVPMGELLSVLAVVIFCYLIASIVSGHIADRHDPRRYTAWVIGIFAASMLVAGLTTDHNLLRAILPFGMFAGAAVLMLAYPILLRVTPKKCHGEYTGYYQFNRGVAVLAGTSLTGFLIDQFGRYFPASHGFQVIWLVGAVVMIVSLPLYLRLTATTR